MKGEAKQSILLIKHFLGNFFYTDILKFDDQHRAKQVALLTILSVMGGFLAHQFLLPYLVGRELSAQDLWQRETIFIALTMILSGIISVLNWDKLLLDKKDYNNLLSLPVKLRTLFMAKFISLLSYAFIIATVFNLFSTLVFLFYPAGLIRTSPLYSGVAHYLANFLGCVFICFGVALVQSLLMIFFKGNLYRKIASLFQVFLLFLFMTALFLVPDLYSLLEKIRENPSALLDYVPPLWFVGIYDQMIGCNNTFISRNLYLSFLLAGLPLILYIVMSPVSLKTYMQTSSTNGKRGGSNSFVLFLARIFNRLFLRKPVERGIFYFYIKTLKRSRSHLLKLTLYMALPISFIMSKFSYRYLEGGIFDFWEISFDLISVPLILYFFLVIGLRMVVRYPVDLNANWLFRLSSVDSPRYYLKALKKALFFTALLPVFIILYPFYHYFWGMKNAIYHLFYSITIALLLMEICFLNFKKIAFTAEYMPEKFKMRYYWPVYFLVFLEYYISLSRLGLSLITNPRYYILFYTVALGIFAGLKIYQHIKDKRGILVFEENAESVMLTLGFDD